MDKPRKNTARDRWIRRGITSIVLVAAIGATTYGLSRLKPAEPTVEKSTVWMATVKRGPMVRQVRGLGTLAPEEILFIPAINQGPVVRIVMRPGAQVTPRARCAIYRKRILTVLHDETRRGRYWAGDPPADCGGTQRNCYAGEAGGGSRLRRETAVASLGE